MRKFDKAIILLIGVGILITFLKDKFYKKPNEIVVAGHRVDKQPCISGMNELFGKGVDSSKMCDCLLPKFCQLIKNDPAKVQKFEEIGFFKVEGSARDSATQIFRECVLDNIVDTSYKLDINQFKESFLQKLQDSIKLIPGWEQINADSLGSCLLETLDGKVTIKEYFSDDYLKMDKLREAILKCRTKALKNK